MSEITTPSQPEGRRRALLGFLSARAAPLASFLVLLLMLVVCNVMAPGFVSVTNLMQIAQLSAFLGIAAIGQTLVILSGGIDLSIAWTITGAACVFTQVSQGQADMLLPALAGAAELGDFDRKKPGVLNDDVLPALEYFGKVLTNQPHSSFALTAAEADAVFLGSQIAWHYFTPDSSQRHEGHTESHEEDISNHVIFVSLRMTFVPLW